VIQRSHTSEEGAREFDVVLLDVEMPRVRPFLPITRVEETKLTVFFLLVHFQMNGITAIRIIREREASGKLPPGPMKVLCLVSSASKEKEEKRKLSTKLISSPSFPSSSSSDR